MLTATNTPLLGFMRAMSVGPATLAASVSRRLRASSRTSPPAVMEEASVTMVSVSAMATALERESSALGKLPLSTALMYTSLSVRRTVPAPLESLASPSTRTVVRAWPQAKDRGM